jgi:opacity protein-like surface antigen
MDNLSAKDKNKMRTKRSLAFRLLLCVGLLMCPTALALGQGGNTDGYPKFEFFGGYSALGDADSRGISFGNGASTSGDFSTFTGFETSLIGNFNKHFGIKGDFSAHFNNERALFPVTVCTPTCVTATQDNELKTRLYNFLIGPEIKARNHTRFTPFAYGLAGVAHTSATFTTGGPTINFHLEHGDNSFAMAVGGGLDIRATERVSFRGSMDYNPVFVNDSVTGTRHLVRLSLGVLFH